MKTLLLTIGVVVAVAVSAISISPTNPQNKVSTEMTQPAGGTTTVSPQALSEPSGSDTTKSVQNMKELHRSTLESQGGVGDTTKVKE
jgi:hypothetical protein